MAAKELSLRHVMLSVMVIFAFVGWGHMASMYVEDQKPTFSEEPPTPDGGESHRMRHRTRNVAGWAVVVFCTNALSQIPNVFAVFTHNFSQHLWIPISIVVIEGLTVFAWVKMKGLEAEMKRERRRTV